MQVSKGYTTDLFYTPNKRYRWEVYFLNEDDRVEKMLALHMTKRHIFDFIGKHKQYHSAVARTSYPNSWDRLVCFKFENS